MSSAPEYGGWHTEVLPLPRELEITGVLRLAPAAIGIRGRAEATALEKSSTDHIAGLFREKTGIAPQGREFEILIGVMDEAGAVAGRPVPHAGRLRDLPNSDQAYLIQPDGPGRLVVAALTDRGLFYATRTLAQWLAGHLDPKHAEIPLAKVVDWPALAERGFWHMPVSLVPWLAELKFNRFFDSQNFRVDDRGEIRVFSNHNEKNDALREAWTPPYDKVRMQAAEWVPGPTHFDFWEHECPGYKEAFPHLIGRGESAKDPFTFARFPQRVPCASQPDLRRILQAVMSELAGQGAGEIMVWTSEYPEASCQCPDCTRQGQFRAEVSATVAAWQAAKADYPQLKLSVFFGRGGFFPPPDRRYPDREIEEIADGLPSGVVLRVSYGCDGADGRLMEKFATAGRKISRMNVVFFSPAFFTDDIRERMQEIADAGYIGAWQIVYQGRGPDASARLQKLFDFRLSAMAEYAWNPHGRSAAELAGAWARRRGLDRPEAFVEWIGVMQVPQARRMMLCTPGHMFESWFGRLRLMARQRQWDGDLFQEDELTPGLQQSARGLALAGQLGEEDFLRNAQALHAYCRLEEAGYRFIAALGETGDNASARRESAGRACENLRSALEDYIPAREAISFVPAAGLRAELEVVAAIAAAESADISGGRGMADHPAFRPSAP